MKIIDYMRDNRSDCYSIMIRINIDDYLKLINASYEKTGNIEGQRDPISSKTGKRIRDIMVDDIKKGAILPPLVLGCVIDNDKFKQLNETTDNYEDINLEELIDEKQLSIIDGMQRTTALMELERSGQLTPKDIRIEIWLTNNPNNLIYRMLVLNTGQISWSLKKQLEVVFSHVANLMEERIPGIQLFNSNDNKRSTGSGQYQISHMVELYLGFATRKEKLDLNKEVTERFAKLDIVDLSSKFNHLEYFIEIVNGLVQMDRILEKDVVGKRIFGDQHARIAFIVSISKKIFGKASITKSEEEVKLNFENMKESLEKFIEKLTVMNENGNLKDFCAMDVFEEFTENMGKQDLIDFYKCAFDDMVESNFDVVSFEECWRAYE